MATMGVLRNGVRDRRGGVALEFALMTPILVFTILGMLDFARVLAADSRAANAALAGVHFGMQSPAHAADIDGIIRAARADARDTAEELGITAQQSCACANGAAILCSLSCEDGDKPIMHVKVSVSHEYETMMDYPMFTNPVPLFREAEFRVQ